MKDRIERKDMMDRLDRKTGLKNGHGGKMRMDSIENMDIVYRIESKNRIERIEIVNR